MISPNAVPERSRWPLGRFLSTLSFFNAIPLIGNLNCVKKMLGQTSSPSFEQSARLQQSGVVLVLGSGARLAPVLIKHLTGQGYRVRWLTHPTSTVQPPVETVRADLTQPNALPPQLLEDVQVIVGCLSAAEQETVAPWLQAIFPQLRDARTLLFDFTRPTVNLQDWGALDDVVMGGVSESNLRRDAEGVVFFGNVSTANSGGFASVRTRNFAPPLNLSGGAGLELRVRGDGNRYKLMLRSESGWDSLAYAASFDTPADGWTTVRIPFSDLRPVFRARTVTTAQPMNPSRIHALQLMLSKFEYDGSLNPHFTPGPFQLTVSSIRLYGNAVLPQVVLALPDSGISSPSSLEAALRQTQLSYALFRVGEVIEGEGTRSLIILQNGATPGSISQGDLAELCVAAIAHPQASGVSATVASGQGVCPPGDWDCLFGRMQS